METWRQRSGASGPLDAGRALDPAYTRDAGAGRVLVLEDLVLIDVTMPGLDGFQLAKRLRRAERTPRIPLIFLSGEVGQANAQRDRALGAVAYLTQLFDPRRLAAFVAHALAAGRAGPSELTATVANDPCPIDMNSAPREGEEMQVQAQPKQEFPHIEHVEPRRERLRRHGHRTRLYTLAFSLVALLVVLIALVVANTRQVKLSWVAGSGHASLVWIILASAVLGWLGGIVTSVVFRLRTRRPRRPTGRLDASSG